MKPDHVESEALFMHPMLQVLAPPGLLYVNGRFCGEADGGGTPLIRDGVAYVEYRPLGRWNPGVALKLTMRGGLLMDGVPDDVYAVQWPGGLLELEFRGGETYEPPTIHAQLKTPFGQLVLQESHGTLAIGYEGEDFADLPLLGPFMNLGLRTQPHPSMPLVAVTGQCDDGPFTVMCRLEHPPQILQTIQGRPMDWAFDNSPGITPRIQRGTPGQISREWLELTLTQNHSAAARLLANNAHQQRFASSLGEFDQVVAMKYPVPGLAPVEWGALKLVAAQIAHVSAVGFVGYSDDSGWKIERVITHGTK